MNIDEQDKDLAALEIMKRAFFASTACDGLTLQDREDVGQAAVKILLKYPFDPKRKTKNGLPIRRDCYLHALLPLALKIWRKNEKIWHEAYSQLQAANAVHESEESLVDQVADPLSLRESERWRNNGAILLFDEPGLEEGLQEAPCKVQFVEPFNPGVYHRRPFHVPKFDLVPLYHDEEGREILAVATHAKQRGKRRRFHKEKMTRAAVEQIEDRRLRMAGYASRLIPLYLKNFGWKSLDGRLQRLVALFNSKKGYTPEQIQFRLKIGPNTYYSHLASLGRRGWLKAWSKDRDRPVLWYFPARDRCRSLHSTMIGFDKVTIGEILAMSGPLIEDELYSGGEASDTAIERELYAIRRGLAEAAHDYKAEAEYDKKLRLFIMEFFDLPVETGMPLEDLEEKFENLTDDQRLSLFCNAIRLRRSLFDVIAGDLSALFADMLKPRIESERKACEHTLATFELALSAIQSASKVPA